MKPHDAAETRRRRALGRARTRVKAHLGFLRGYPRAVSPGAVSWSVPLDALRTLGRVELSRAARALRDLRDEDRDALPVLVADSRAFLAGAERLLAWLSEIVPRGACPESIFEAEPSWEPAVRRRAAALRRGAPALAPLVEAVGWYCLAAPDEAPPLLDVVRERAPALTRLSALELPADLRDLVLRLGALAALEPAPLVHPLAAALLDPIAHETPTRTGQHPEAVASWLTGGAASLPDPPRPRWGSALVAWLDRLLAADAPARRVELRCFAAVDPMPLVARWSEWWAAVENARRGARGLRAHAKRMPPEIADLRVGGARARLKKLAAAAPPELDPDTLFTALAELAAPAARAAGEALPALLACLRDPLSTARADIVLAWSNSADLGARLAELTLALPHDETVLRSFVPEERRIWSIAILLEHLVDLLPDAAARERFCSALEHVTAQRGAPLTRRELEILPVFAAELETEAAVEAFLALQFSKLAESPPREACIRAALRLAGADELLAVLPRLAEAEADDATFALLGEWARRPAVRALARDLVLEGRARPLLELCAHALALKSAGAPLPPPELPAPASPPAWAERLPPELGPALSQLAAFEPDAEAAVARILGAEFRPPASLARELEALRARPDAAALRRRMEVLEERLREPPRPGPERTRKLQAKLERSLRLRALDRAGDALAAHARAAIGERLGLPSLPDAWLKPPTLGCLIAAAGLSRESRRVAGVVLRARLGPPPWDLRDHPGNAAFLAGLRARGVDVGPWLDGIETQGAHAEDGGELLVALEPDPLELLEMGAHFRTCLSPGGVNYFSVFSNLADVNKRVLYARDRAGAVRGRCLLGLTARGAIVTFNPYTHGGFDWAAAVRRFAVELARRMGVVVLARGEVPKLVASDWYDDGPVDVGEQLPALRDGSELRRSLPGLVPAAFVEELGRALAPLPLGAITLPLVVALPELDARADLVVPLLPQLAGTRDLPVETLERAVRLAAQAGALELVRGTLVPRLVDEARRRLTPYWAGELAGFLAALLPSQALRLLRDTRGPGVRALEEDPLGVRLYAGARALQTLGRRTRALDLYRRALRAPEGEVPKQLCKERIRELRRPRKRRGGDRLHIS